MLMFHSTWCVIDQDHNMPKCSIKISSSCTSKSLLCTSFPIACPSVRETIGFPRWSRVEHRKLISKLCSRVYLSIKQYKRSLYSITKYNIELYLLMYTREFCKDNLMKVIVRMGCKHELTCNKEEGEGITSATRWLSLMKALKWYNLLN